MPILHQVENGPFHSLPSRLVRGQARTDALLLVTRGLLRLLPAKGRFPRRFVVTAAGSHYLGTFVGCE